MLLFKHIRETICTDLTLHVTDRKTQSTKTYTDVNKRSELAFSLNECEVIGIRADKNYVIVSLVKE